MQKLNRDIEKYITLNIPRDFMDACNQMYEDYFKTLKLSQTYNMSGVMKDLYEDDVMELFDILCDRSKLFYESNILYNKLEPLNNFIEAIHKLCDEYLQSHKTHKTHKGKTNRKTTPMKTIIDARYAANIQPTQPTQPTQHNKCKSDEYNEFIYELMHDDTGKLEQTDRLISKLPSTVAGSGLFEIYLKILFAYIIWYEIMLMDYSNYMVINRHVANIQIITTPEKYKTLDSDKTVIVIPEDKTELKNKIYTFFGRNRDKFENIIFDCYESFTSHILTDVNDKQKIINTVRAKIQSAYEKYIKQKEDKVKSKIENLINVDTRLSPGKQTEQETISFVEVTRLSALAKDTKDTANKLYADIDRLYAKIKEDVISTTTQLASKGTKLQKSELLDEDMIKATEIQGEADTILDRANYLLESIKVLRFNLRPPTTSPIATRLRKSRKTKTSQGAANNTQSKKGTKSKKQRKTTAGNMEHSEVETQIMEKAAEIEVIVNSIKVIAEKTRYIAVSAKNCLFNALQAYNLGNEANKLQQIVNDLENQQKSGSSMNATQLKNNMINIVDMQKNLESIVNNMKNSPGPSANIVYQPELDAKKEVINMVRKINIKLTLANTTLTQIFEKLAQPSKPVDASNMKLQTHQEYRPETADMFFGQQLVG
jgi:hypothetical protein